MSKALAKTLAIGAGILGVAWLIGLAFSRPILDGQTFSREIVDRNEKLLRITLSGDEKYRVFVPLDQIPENFIEAVLLHEDRHFRRHFGVNPWALVKAAGKTYVGGRRRMGGSTITMQLARMTSTRGSKTLLGKVVQIARAVQIELYHSKDEILEAYLNLLPYGANIEGIGAASRIYFDKEPRGLSLAESLTLAVVPQNPNLRQPHVDNGRALRSARGRLLKAWLQVHPENQEAITTDVELPFVARKIGALPFHAPHYVNLVLERSAAFNRLHHRSGDESRIRTGIDLKLQSTIEKKVSSYVDSKQSLGIRNASALVLDHETMEVVSMVGSVRFFDDSILGQVNGALGKRSPGSTLKPFVYALALDQGLIHPHSLLKDTPMSFGAFDPENFDRGFVGPVSATAALTRSRNVPAVHLASLLKAPGLYDFLRSSGVTRLREPGFYGLSLSLGGAEVTMEELVKLYAMLANRGEIQDLRYIRSREQNSVKPKANGIRLLSPEAAFLTLDMLRSNQRSENGFAERWMRDKTPVAWKTGTSHGFRDAWTVGVVGPYVVAVWLGNFNGESNPALIGRDLAAPLFFNIVDIVKHNAKSDHLWLKSDDLRIRKVKACALSGQMPGAHCKQKIFTWFMPGKSPIAPCSIHREILISKRTGERACEDSRSGVKKEIFEFWPSDLLQVFRLAGIPRRPPPPYERDCDLSRTQSFGLAPVITSPKREVVYSYRVVGDREKSSEEMIPLLAVSDGDARLLHWFLGSEYLGKTEPQKPLLWRPRPGRFNVRVVDDLGRVDSREVEVKVTR